MEQCTYIWFTNHPSKFYSFCDYGGIYYPDKNTAVIEPITNSQIHIRIDNLFSNFVESFKESLNLSKEKLIDLLLEGGNVTDECIHSMVLYFMSKIEISIRDLTHKNFSFNTDENALSCEKDILVIVYELVLRWLKANAYYEDYFQ